MSQDSEEIKTIEQWKWSEMQGLELVPPSPIPESTEENASKGGEGRDIMETSEPKKGSDAGDKPESSPAVGFGELFRFADGLDYILMGIGTAGAIVHGCSLPLFLRFFADLVNSFGANANDVDKMTQEVVKVMQFLTVLVSN